MRYVDAMLRATLCLAFVGTTLLAQQVTLAEGTATSLAIVALDESNLNAPGTVLLQHVELLPVEVTGRTLAHEGDPARSRRTTRQGIVCVALRDGGWLYRYRRSGGAFWGFLHVAANGTPQVVLELPGVGAGGAQDPFFDRIAVAGDGRHAAIAPASGGLHVVRLDGSVYASTGRVDRSILAAPTLVEPASMLVGSDVVWFQTENVQVFRCELADGASPVDVTPPPVPNAELKEEMAMTPDGSRVVFLYGPNDLYRLFRADRVGPAVALAMPPGKYEEPDYLPEGPGEPAMLLNDSGTRLFCVESAIRDELYLVDLTAGLPTLQVTGDAIFQPYIGVHVLPKFAADRLTIAVGDPAAMDWFQADLTEGGNLVTNLTNTGTATQPFASGTLSPVDAVVTGQHVLAVEQQGNSLWLRRLDASTGTHTLLHQDLAGMPRVGSGFGGTTDLVVPTAAGQRLYHGASAAPFAALPPGLDVDPIAHGPLYAATTVRAPGGFGIGVLYLHGGPVATGLVESGLQQLALTQAGGTVVIGNPLRYVAVGTYLVLNRAAVPVRLCLSGVGA